MKPVAVPPTAVAISSLRRSASNGGCGALGGLGAGDDFCCCCLGAWGAGVAAGLALAGPDATTLGGTTTFGGGVLAAALGGAAAAAAGASGFFSSTVAPRALAIPAAEGTVTLRPPTMLLVESASVAWTTVLCILGWRGGGWGR